jgi:hypothetical protein
VKARIAPFVLRFRKPVVVDETGSPIGKERRHAAARAVGTTTAYVLLALAIAASTRAFAVLHAWDSPSISGSAPGYRYLALG